jgi:putative sterol carrier protein
MREFSLFLRGIGPETVVTMTLNGQKIDDSTVYEDGTLTLRCSPVLMQSHDYLVVTAEPHTESLVLDQDHRLLMARKLVETMRMESLNKQRLAGQLPQFLAGSLNLTAYEFALVDSQKRALAELLTGCGYQRTHLPGQGGEALILWNNANDERVNYRFLAQDLDRQAVLLQGQVPHFAKLTIIDETVEFQSSEQAAVGRVSVGEWFDSLVARSEDLALQEMAAVIQFDIRGSSGRTAYLAMKDGRVMLGDGQHPQPNTSITAEAADWLAMINGDAGLEEMFMGGKLLITGDLNLILPLAGMVRVNPPRKYLEDGWRLEIEYPNGLRFVNN